MSKAVLVIGATGKQGGGLVDALLASANSSDFLILGVTRDEKSVGAEKLKAKSPSIKIVQGNMNDVPALFKAAAVVAQQPIWGVFSVQMPMGQGQNISTEETYGKAMIDEALKTGVKKFVYTSVERGGDEKSWTNPTPVPHFISKHNIELHLRDAAAKSEMEWTILRPVAFMDNVIPGLQGKIFPTAWRDVLGQEIPLQLIASKDIGWFAAKAYTSEEFKNQAIGLAGDSVSFAQFDEAFLKATGKPAPVTFSFVTNFLLWALTDISLMMNWFKTDGYAADIAKLRSIHPELMDLETWLRKESEFTTK